MSERELPGYTYLPPPRLSYQPSIALVPGVMQVRPPASPASPVGTGAGTQVLLVLLVLLVFLVLLVLLVLAVLRSVPCPLVHLPITTTTAAAAAMRT